MLRACLTKVVSAPPQPFLRRLTTSVAAMSATGGHLAPKLALREQSKQAFEKRLQIKAKNSQVLFNQAEFRLIGAHQLGFSPCLLVTSEHNRFLFNASPGVLRFCYSNKIKLNQTEHILLTNLEPERIAGVASLGLTLQGIGSVSLTVHSTAGFQGYFEALKHTIVQYTGMKFQVRDSTLGPFQTKGLHVEPIVLDGPLSDSKPDEAQPNATKKRRSDPRLVAYCCRMSDMPGQLDPAKCKAMGVPVGPLLAKLKSGQDVELADGRTVKSADVCEPKSIGLTFLVVECPSLDDIQLLSNNAQLQKLVQNKQAENQILLVCHFTREEIVKDQGYHDWMDSFSSDCKHFFLSNTSSQRLNFLEDYKLQRLLNELDPVIFPPLPLPPFYTDASVTASDKPDTYKSINDDSDTVFLQKCKYDDLERFYQPDSLDRIIFRPRKIVTYPKLDPSFNSRLDAARELDGFEESLAELRQLQAKFPAPREHEPEVVFLGTGSAIPSKHRNVSGILVNLKYPVECSVILDCGDDTYGQLVRHYGLEEATAILSRLRLVYVSHVHADHHLGLSILLRERNKVTKSPVVLLLPPNVDSTVLFYQDLVSSCQMVNTQGLTLTTRMNHVDLEQLESQKSHLLSLVGDILSDITLVQVKHCANSCASVMNFNVGHPEMASFKLAYSGDCRPSSLFAEQARGCDLLIHEATFDHDSQQDAILKKHSTTTEAIELSRLMEAKFTVLTHFSQRYHKIPVFTDHFDERIGFAFDHLALRCPSSFGRLPIMKPMLAKTFHEALNDVASKRLFTQQKTQIIKELLDE